MSFEAYLLTFINDMRVNFMYILVKNFENRFKEFRGRSLAFFSEPFSVAAEDFDDNQY